MDETNLVEANLHQADLRHAYLHHADLSNARLTNANLQGADLSWTTLQQADLLEADLLGALLSHADLRETQNLTDDQFVQAYALWGSLMPNGTRYDGRYRLAADVAAAPKPDDTNGMRLAAVFFQVTSMAYEHAQAWAQYHLSNLRDEQAYLASIHDIWYGSGQEVSGEDEDEPAEVAPETVAIATAAPEETSAQAAVPDAVGHDQVFQQETNPEKAADEEDEEIGEAEALQAQTGQEAIGEDAPAKEDGEPEDAGDDADDAAGEGGS
jgi:hypothetical protein